MDNLVIWIAVVALSMAVWTMPLWAQPDWRVPTCKAGQVGYWYPMNFHEAGVPRTAFVLTHENLSDQKMLTSDQVICGLHPDQKVRAGIIEREVVLPTDE